VLGFRTSSNLAAAYGVAVTTDMVFTAILLFVVQRDLWRWKLLPAALLTAFFLTIDLSFWTANIVKVPQGGWFPLVVAVIIFTLMKTWKDGREILGQRIREGSLPLDLFLKDVKKHPPLRVPGIAVFMSGNPATTPPALLHNLKHNKVLHERVVILSVMTAEVPHVPPEERLDVTALEQGFYQIVIRSGFMETPDVPAELARLRIKGLTFRRMETTYFLGRERILATKRKGMMIWRERLFAWIAQNSRSATFFFNLPPERVVELGAQIEM
jgi:KUP system potassium uptake protein